MPDDSALRTSLDELREMQEGELADGENRDPAPPEKTETAGSLLDDLLAETQNQARKEMDEVKAALQEKDAAKAAAKKHDQEERRRQLDELRRQEGERRGSMIRERERRLARERGEDIEPPENALPIIAPRSSNGLIAGVLVVLVISAGGYWFYTDWQAKQEAIAKAAAAAQAKTAEEQKQKDLAEAKAAREKTAAANHEKMLASLREQVRSNAAEMRSPRRSFDLYAGGETLPDTKVHRGKRRRGRRATTGAKARRLKRKVRKGGIKIRRVRLDRL